MLILTYFNPIIGPDILYSVPENISELVSEDDIGQIKRLMDAATPGFFTHAFSAELNTANFFFMIPSLWARGKQEMVMITKIIEEESPNLNAYENEFRQFVKNIREKREFIFKALYINNPPLNYEREITKEFDILTQEFNTLAKFFAISQAQTHGILIPLQQLRQRQSIHLPLNILREMESFIEKKKNYFVVFQKRKENFKVDIIPYDGERIIKIAVIFNGQLSPDTLKEISMVFQEMKLPFVYTSGICQQGGKCIYEVYLNPMKFENFDETKERLRKIRDVDEIKVIEIELMKVE